MNRHRPRLQLHILTSPRTVVGTLAVHLQRGIRWRDLLDCAREVVEHACDRSQRRKTVGPRHHLALGVERVGLFAELDREHVGLGRIEHAARQLGRLAQCDGQHAFRQRVERAAMADLGLGISAFPQHALDRCDALGRAHAARLVEHYPAVGRVLAFHAHSSGLTKWRRHTAT